MTSGGNTARIPPTQGRAVPAGPEVRVTRRSFREAAGCAACRRPGRGVAYLGAVEAASLGGSGACVSQEKGAGRGGRGPRRTGKCRVLGVAAWEAWAGPLGARRPAIGGCADRAGRPLCLSAVRAATPAGEATAGTVSRGAGCIPHPLPARRGVGARTLHAIGRCPRAPLAFPCPLRAPTPLSPSPGPPHSRERRALRRR